MNWFDYVLLGMPISFLSGVMFGVLFERQEDFSPMLVSSIFFIVIMFYLRYGEIKETEQK